MSVTHEELIEALQRYFGFDSFKGNQEAIIRNVMEGKEDRKSTRLNSSHS